MNKHLDLPRFVVFFCSEIFPGRNGTGLEGPGGFYKSWFPESFLTWALNLRSKILLFMRPFGPLVKAGSLEHDLQPDSADSFSLRLSMEWGHGLWTSR